MKNKIKLKIVPITFIATLMFTGFNINSMNLGNNSKYTSLITTAHASNITGTVTIKYVDMDTKKEISPSVKYTNLELDTHAYVSKNIKGYNLVGTRVRTVNLWSQNTSETITYQYQKEKTSTIPKSSIGKPEDFKLKSDKDDTASIQKALDKYQYVELTSGKTYYISDTLILRGNRQLYSTGSKKAIIVQNNKKSAIKNINSVVDTFTIKTGLNKGTIEIPTKNKQNIKNADLILFKSDKLWHWDNRNSLYKGELHKVHTYNNNIIRLKEKMFDSYGKNETITVEVYRPQVIKIENIEFRHPSPIDTVMINLQRIQLSEIKNVSIYNSKNTGLLLNNSYQTNISGIYAELNSGLSTNTGYGVQDYGGTYTEISDSTFKKLRRGVDLSGKTPSRKSAVINCKAYGPSQDGVMAVGNSGFGTHSTASDVVFIGNYSEGFTRGFNLRGENILVQRNTVKNATMTFATMYYGDRAIIRDNEYIATSTKYRINYFVERPSYNKEGYLRISSNKSTKLNKDWVASYVKDYNSKLRNNKITT